jgi:hypothetical protein
VRDAASITTGSRTTPRPARLTGVRPFSGIGIALAAAHKTKVIENLVNGDVTAPLSDPHTCAAIRHFTWENRCP